jgi:Predicted transcriptional regulators
MKGKDVILGLLRKSDLTGYEITEIFQTRLSHFFDASTGMVYPALKSLEKDSYVTVKEVVQHGKPNKKLYKITQNGEDYFDKIIHQDVDSDVYKSDFLVHLYFDEVLTNNEMIQIVEQEQLRISNRLNQLVEFEKEWADKPTDGQHFSIKYGQAMYRAQLSETSKMLKELKSKKSD